jgi:4-methylaminobutanoate oxidase (formaldehyde-forming)
MAHWMLNGKADMDITQMNLERLHPYQANPEYRRSRTVESLGLVYQCHYPNRSMTTARGAKRSAIHHLLEAKGAYFRDVSGWEGADWYSPDGGKPDPGPLTWGKPSWFDQWAREHKACREGVILMDMSFMSKFLVQGKDAGRALNWVSGGNVDGATGEVVYTQWLNDEGFLEGDLTVTKMEDERFMVVATDTQPEDAVASVTDVTSALCQINIQGPNSRRLMEKITTADLSDEAFPFRCAREIDIGFARVLVLRITYLGELGYELYIPSEQAVHVYELLVEAGEEVGLVHAGLKALASLRMEKGYRDYGHDIDNTDTILEAGLSFAMDLKKEGGFLGKDAVVEKKAAEWPPRRRLMQIQVLDPDPMMFHGEVVYRDDEPVGYIRAASYGHTLGGAVGLAMIHHTESIKINWPNDGKWEVEIGARRYPAKASLRPLYDPKNERIKM